MYYIIYKTTNTVNNKFYIGAHRTESLDDTYLGSGIRLKRAIAKYGRDNFSREILEVCETEELMYTRERELVDTELLRSDNTYNLVVGGRGVPEKYTWARTNPIAQRNHARQAGLRSVELKRMRGDAHHSEVSRQQISKTLTLYYREHGSPNTGKIRTRITCPHCGKEGAANTMKRWHFDNCVMAT